MKGTGQPPSFRMWSEINGSFHFMLLVAAGETERPFSTRILDKSWSGCKGRLLGLELTSVGLEAGMTVAVGVAAWAVEIACSTGWTPELVRVSLSEVLRFCRSSER